MAIETINISEIRKQIDEQIGVSALNVPGVNKELVNAVLNSGPFEEYLQDQIYRWVIRAYLVNAKLQEYITEEQFQAYIEQAKTEQGREQLAASIILSSVPMAEELPQFQYISVEPDEQTEPHLTVVAH